MSWLSESIGLPRETKDALMAVYVRCTQTDVGLTALMSRALSFKPAKDGANKGTKRKALRDLKKEDPDQAHETVAAKAAPKKPPAAKSAPSKKKKGSKKNSKVSA